MNRTGSPISIPTPALKNPGTVKANFPFEIIVHDDASTDNTVDIVREYETKFPLFFKNIYQTENQFSKSIHSVTKITFAAARGKYIALCEGDDYWCDENKLQKQVDFLEKTPGYSICYHHCLNLKDGEFVDWDDRKSKSSEFNFLDSLYGKNGYTVSMMFRNEDFNINEYIAIAEHALIGDWPLELLLLSKNKKGFFLPETMAIYRYHMAGISKRPVPKETFLKDRLDIATNLRKYAINKRQLDFFIGELYLHMSLQAQKSQAKYFFKGLGLVLLNIHFKKSKNINKRLSLQNFISLFFKRIKGGVTPLFIF